MRSGKIWFESWYWHIMIRSALVWKKKLFSALCWFMKVSRFVSLLSLLSSYSSPHFVLVINSIISKLWNLSRNTHASWLNDKSFLIRKLFQLSIMSWPIYTSIKSSFFFFLDLEVMGVHLPCLFYILVLYHDFDINCILFYILHCPLSLT